jgi:tungstate transport system substrate-binding protein
MSFYRGPGDDPAKIAEAKSAAEAYQKIAAPRPSSFPGATIPGPIKRKWTSGRKPKSRLQGDWYVVTKDFMTATLKRANRTRAISWWTAAPGRRRRRIVPNLKMLFKGDKALVNTYHTLCQPAGATPGAATAVKFIDFVASPRGKRLSPIYGKDKHGEGLYNDAAYAKKYDD